METKNMFKKLRGNPVALAGGSVLLILGLATYLGTRPGVPRVSVELSKSSASTTTAYLSDLTPTYASNGWGPYEKNKSNGEALAGDGKTITLNGQTYAKGLGTHGLSDLRYNLGGNCTSFTAKVGIDDEVSKGSVVFTAYADGTKIFESPKMYYNSATLPVSADLTGKKELKLVVGDAADGIGGDHADWADAKITCTTPDAPTPPPPPAASPEASIKVLQWNNGGEAGQQQAEIDKIVALKPQVVFLQEMDSANHATSIMNALKTDQGGTTWDTYSVLRGTDTGSSYVSIISKYDLTNTKYVDLRKAGSYSMSCYKSGVVRTWAGRRAVGANITVNGKNISLFSVRTSSDGDMNCVRKDEMATLEAWAYNSANGFHTEKIFGGDFNMQPNNTEYTYFASAPYAHTDTWKVAIQSSTDSITAVADNDSTPDLYTPTKNTRMDYIFTNSDSTLKTSSTLIRNVGTLSDHRMMSTVLSLQ